MACRHVDSDGTRLSKRTEYVPPDQISKHRVLSPLQSARQRIG